MMIYINEAMKTEAPCKKHLEVFAQLIAPFCPHLGEELWRILGNGQSLAYEPWPEWDPEMIKEDTIKIAVQVNGKVRDEMEIPADADQEQVRALALDRPKIQKYVEGMHDL